MSTVTILAFDPGTANMGYSVLTGNTTTTDIHIASTLGVLTTAKRKNGVNVQIRERIDHLSISIQQIVENVKPTCIVMEDFVEQGKYVGKTYKEMAFLTEHMRLLTQQLGLPATIYANGYWKKQTLGISRASKVQVQHYISHKIPEATTILKKQPDHVWDSVGIGYCKWLEILSTKGPL